MSDHMMVHCVGYFMMILFREGGLVVDANEPII